MALAFSPRQQPTAPDRPATARLRAGLWLAGDGEALVDLFADALAEDGITGHFCVAGTDGALIPILGDAPDLIGRMTEAMVVDAPVLGARVLLRMPDRVPAADTLVRVRGYAQLYAARALDLRELADDVETGCGLSLRERYVLGRRLAGLAPIDIACESGLSVATVSLALDQAVSRLGTPDLASATALAARRGWLAVTTLQNFCSSSENITYTVTKNG